MAGPEPLLVAGRYALYDEIAAGGMATVHLGRLVGGAGFARVVAIKRLHPQHAKNPEVVTMLMDEARLAARVHHPNVAATIDVLEEGHEVLLVFEYVAGESLGGLVRMARNLGERVPIDVASAIAIGALHGLHAAHEARTAEGVPLEIVHRDVSPQNVLVGADGLARVIDFGIAKANLRSSATREGELKGKLIYMAPEQLAGRDVTRASDIYAAGVLLWEVLAGRRLFDQPTHAGIVAAILSGPLPRLVDEAPWVPAAAAAVVERALARDPAARWPTASAMAAALDAALPPASAPAVAAFVERVAESAMARRRKAVLALESATVPTGAARGAGADGGSRRFRTGPALVALVLVLVSVGLGAGLTLAWIGRAAPEPGGEDVRPAEGADATAAPPTATVAPVAEPSAAADPSSSPDEIATADGEPPAAGSPPVRPRPAPRPRASAGDEPPPLPACDPPWEVDAAGIRRVKRHCIGR